MPELPEVQTVLDTLALQLSNRQIMQVEVYYPPIVHHDDQFGQRLTHQHFRSFLRRGKYLIFKMDDLYLISHLRMEGKYFIQMPEEPLSKHIHVQFWLDDGRCLRYHDTRKFGRMELVEHLDLDHFHDLGLEPFDLRLNTTYLYEKLHQRNIPIKTLLLDQSIIAGIGNIYADEILFAAKIHPLKKGNRISRKNCQNLIEQTRRILKEAIASGGTTIRSYTSSLGITGRFQLQVQVHTKTQCPICQKPLTIRKIGQRTTYYCSHCQK